MRTADYKWWPSALSSLSLLGGIGGAYLLVLDTDNNLLENDLVGLLLGAISGTGLSLIFLLILILRSFTPEALQRQDIDQSVADSVCCLGMFRGGRPTEDLLTTSLLPSVQL